MTDREKLQESRILEREIEKHQKAYERAQDYYACGCASAGRTMDRHTTIIHALESYLSNRDGKSAILEQNIAIAEVMQRADEHIERFGERSLPVRKVIGEIKRILRGGV